MSPREALQTALAAEHAALHVYGALGASTSASASPGLFAELTASYAEHRARRDLLTARVLDQGGEPVAAEAAYELPDGLDSARRRHPRGAGDRAAPGGDVRLGRGADQRR